MILPCIRHAAVDSPSGVITQPLLVPQPVDIVILEPPLRNRLEQPRHRLLAREERGDADDRVDHGDGPFRTFLFAEAERNAERVRLGALDSHLRVSHGPQVPGGNLVEREPQNLRPVTEARGVVVIRGLFYMEKNTTSVQFPIRVTTIKMDSPAGAKSAR